MWDHLATSCMPRSIASAEGQLGIIMVGSCSGSEVYRVPVPQAHLTAPCWAPLFYALPWLKMKTKQFVNEIVLLRFELARRESFDFRGGDLLLTSGTMLGFGTGDVPPEHLEPNLVNALPEAHLDDNLAHNRFFESGLVLRRPMHDRDAMT